MSTIEHTRLAVRIVGLLILLLSIFTPAEIFKLAKQYRSRWQFWRKWRQIAFITSLSLVLVAGVVMVSGYVVWLGWAILGVGSLFTASTPCSSPKWRRTRIRRIVRNLFFYGVALWLFGVAYSLKNAGF